MRELWGALVILIVCPLLGALPVIAWITYALKRRRLTQIGTKNVSVSAAFYHGGKLVGILAVVSEALKGIVAIYIARSFFPEGSFWELLSLIALVLGRYLIGKGAGTTNVFWGLLVHDPLVTIFVGLLAIISFMLLQSRNLVKYGVLFVFPLFVILLHAEDIPKIITAIALATLLWWIYKKIPDDLTLSSQDVNAESQATFEYLRGSEIILTLDDELDQAIAGQKLLLYHKLSVGVIKYPRVGYFFRAIVQKNY